MGRVIRRISLLFFVLFLILLLGLGLFRSRAVPLLCELSQAQAKTAAAALISDAISQEIQQGNISYGKIILFEKDVNGSITALKTNMQEVNRLKSRILASINEDILRLDAMKMGVPLGNLLLPELFGGSGPVIPVRILTVRNSSAVFSSHFTQAGINQTLHQLHMTVSVEGTLLVFGEILSFSASNDVVVAETVIVGDVPNSFS